MLTRTTLQIIQEAVSQIRLLNGASDERVEEMYAKIDYADPREKIGQGPMKIMKRLYRECVQNPLVYQRLLALEEKRGPSGTWAASWSKLADVMNSCHGDAELLAYTVDLLCCYVLHGVRTASEIGRNFVKGGKHEKGITALAQKKWPWEPT